MAKKMMQIDVYTDGTVEMIDAVKTEAAGRPVKAEQTTWKKIHGYLRENEEKEAVAQTQFAVIVTNPCGWVFYEGKWHVFCW